MYKLQLNLRIGVNVGGNNFNWIPKIESMWMPINCFLSKGGVKRWFVDGCGISNEMEIGDELREAIQQENLIVGRGSDVYTSEIYQAQMSQSRLWVVLAIALRNKENVACRLAYLTIHNALISNIERGQFPNPVSGEDVPLDKMNIVFEKRFASIQYRSHQAAIAPKQMAVATTATAAIGG